jgi:site-specific recombinase XerD
MVDTITHSITKAGQSDRTDTDWVSYAHLDPARYGSHSLRRTRVAHIYKKTANLRAVQVLLGHKNIETTTRYLGIEEEQALDIAKQFEI